MNFESTNIELYDYFNTDILEDFEYQKELEKHLNELENVLIEPLSEQIQKESFNEQIKQTSELTLEETSKQTSELTSELTSKQISELTPKETSKQISELTPKETSKQTSELTFELTSKQTPKETSKQISELTPKETSKQISELTSKQTPKETSKQISELTPKETSKQISELTPKETSELTSKQTTKETLKETTKETLKETPKETSELTSKQTPKETSKETFKQTSEEQIEKEIFNQIKEQFNELTGGKIKKQLSEQIKEEPKKQIDEQIQKPIKQKENIKKYNNYKLNINEIKYLNTLPTNTYNEGYYKIDNEFNIKNNNNTQIFTILENKKIQLKESNQIIESSISYYNVSNEESCEIEPITDKKKLDFVAEINHILNPLSTYLTYQYSKSELIYKNPNLIDCLHKCLQQTGDHTTSELTDLFAKFGETLAMFIKTQQNNSLYVNNKTKYKNKNNLWVENKLNKKFNIIQLPKYLINIINHINYYFNQIKDTLKFNEKTGFYNIIYENNEYPLICKHIYLSLIGKSQYEISTLCCINSQCKYCGDSMIDYYYDDENDIPNSILVLVYKLIDLSENSNDDDMFRNIIIKCTSVIAKFVNKSDENYDNKASAIVSIYVYKIIREAIKQDQISEYSKKVTSLIKLITEYCVLVEWDNQKIESLLNNENLFTDVSNVTDLLFKSQKQKNITNDIIEYIFENYSSDELKQFKEKKELSKFNETLLNLIIDNTNFKFIDELIKRIELLSKVTKENEIIFETENNTEDLFEKIIKNYCPENFIHEWTDKKCKNCGIYKNFENVEQIYEKYKLIFNNSFVLSSENKLQNFKTITSNVDNIMKNINSIKDNEIKEHIMKRLNISENEYKIIDQRLFEVIPYIQSYILNHLSISKEYIEKFTEKDMLRLYIYLDKTSDTNMIEIFNYCLLKPTFYFKKQTSIGIYKDDDNE